MNRKYLLEKLTAIEIMRLKADKTAIGNYQDAIYLPQHKEHYKKRAERMFAIANRLDKYFNKLKTQL